MVRTLHNLPTALYRHYSIPCSIRCGHGAKEVKNNLSISIFDNLFYILGWSLIRQPRSIETLVVSRTGQVHDMHYCVLGRIPQPLNVDCVVQEESYWN